ncbi:MAG: hypothetical protein HYY84_16025 [Deltaproteobacteria bacterium]|nr:hypothetical protein [Deltaproteobacteria bacterium]
MLRRRASGVLFAVASLVLASAHLGCSGCDSSPGTSSGCQFDQDCPTGEYCDLVVRACKTGCRSGEKCAQCGYACSASHQCELVTGACCSDSDCSELKTGSACKVCVIGADAGVGTCQTGCLDDTCCSNNAQYCQTTTKTCQNIACSCYDSQVQKCRGNTSCKAHASGTTSVCIAGGCCTDGDCDAGSLFCDSQGTKGPAGTCQKRPCPELGCSSGIDIECKKYWTQTTTYYCSNPTTSTDCDGGSGCCCAGGCSRSLPESCPDPCTLCDGNHACSPYVFPAGQNPNNKAYNSNDTAEQADTLGTGAYKRFLCPSSLQDWFAINIGTDETWTVRVSFDTGLYPSGDPAVTLYGNGAISGTINLDGGISREQGAGIAEEINFIATAVQSPGDMDGPLGKPPGTVFAVSQLAPNGDGGYTSQGAGTYHIKVALPNGSTTKLEYTITLSKVGWPTCNADNGTDDTYDGPDGGAANDTCASRRASDQACQASTLTMTPWDGGGDLAAVSLCSDPHFSCSQFKVDQNPFDAGLRLCDADYYKPSVSLATTGSGVAAACYQFSDQFRARVLYTYDGDGGTCGFSATAKTGDMGIEVWMAGPDAGQEVLFGNSYVWTGDAGAAQKRVGDDGDGGWVFRQTAGAGAPVVAVSGLAGQCNDRYFLEMEALQLKRCSSTLTNSAVQNVVYPDSTLAYVAGVTTSKTLSGTEARCPGYDHWWKMQPQASANVLTPSAADGLTSVTVKLKIPPSRFDAGTDPSFNWANPLKLSVARYTFDGGLVSSGAPLDAPQPTLCDCGDAGYADAGYGTGCLCTEYTYPGAGNIPANELVYFKVSDFGNSCAWSDYTIEYKATTTATCPVTPDTYEMAAGGGCVNNDTPGCAPNILTTFPGSSSATWPTSGSVSLCTNDIDYFKLPSGIQLNDSLTVSIPQWQIGRTAYLVSAVDAGDPVLLDPGDSGSAAVTNIVTSCSPSGSKCNLTKTMGAGNWYLRFANTGSFESPYVVTASISRGATTCSLDPYDTNPDNSNFTAVQADGGRDFYASTSLGYPGGSYPYFTSDNSGGGQDVLAWGCPSGATCRTYWATDPLRLLCTGTDTVDWYKLTIPQPKALVRIELCAFNAATYNPPSIAQQDLYIELHRPNGVGGTTPTCDSDGGPLPAGCGFYACTDLPTYDPAHDYCDCIAGANTSFNRCSYFNKKNFNQEAAVSMGSSIPVEFGGGVQAGDYYLKVYTNKTNTAEFRSYRLAVIEWNSRDESNARLGVIPCSDTAPWR